MTLRVDIGCVCTVKVGRRSVETRGDEMAKSPTTCAQRSVRLVCLHRLLVLSWTFFDFVLRGTRRGFDLARMITIQRSVALDGKGRGGRLGEVVCYS